MIALGPEHEATLREHARRAYPEECCGALLGQLGSPDGESASVRAVQPIDNARADERRRRYLVEPADYLSAERTARALGLALLGFYHSHPDHPAVP